VLNGGKMVDWKCNSIWFDKIDKMKQIKIDYKTNKKDFSLLREKEYGIIWYFNNKEKNFNSFQLNETLEYLEINWSNIQNFQGIENLKNIKRLELHYCTKLLNDSGISKLAETVEWLHINQSKKFVFSSELLKLSKLKVLRLNDCGNIEDLTFLEYFPELVDFRFVNTKIISGDLSPILEHKKIINVGFNNKRHYNFTSEEINKKLEDKNNRIKEYIWNNKYRTFKYNVFE